MNTDRDLEVGAPVRFLERDMETMRRGFARRLLQVIEEVYGPRGGSRFARDVGVPDQTMRPWLAGSTIPSGEKLVAICRATGRSMDWLLFGREQTDLSWDEQQWLKFYREIRGDEHVTKVLYQLMEIAKENVRVRRLAPPKKPT
ncbi:MAG: helix-turn-helix transcriptional regulator [Pseudomonadota bacterium]